MHQLNINSPLVMWHKNIRTFTVDRSDLGPIEHVYQPWTLYNLRTNNAIVFMLARKKISNDGELQAWEFHSAVKGLERMKFVIFND